MIGTGYIAALAATLAFSTAWKVQDWRHDSQQLAVAAKTKALTDENKALVESQAAVFAAGQANAAAHETTVEKEVIRVVTKTEYRNDCLDDDGLRIIADDIRAANARRGLAPDVSASAPAGGQVEGDAVAVEQKDDQPVR